MRNILEASMEVRGGLHGGPWRSVEVSMEFDGASTDLHGDLDLHEPLQTSTDLRGDLLGASAEV